MTATCFYGQLSKKRSSNQGVEWFLLPFSSENAFCFLCACFFFSIKVGTNNRDINAIQHWYIGYIEVSYNRGTPKSSIDKISINGFSMKSTIHNGDPPWLWKAPYLELDGSGWMNTTNIALAWTVETFNFWWVNHRKGSPQNGEIRYWSSDFWVLNHIES